MHCHHWGTRRGLYTDKVSSQLLLFQETTTTEVYTTETPVYTQVTTTEETVTDAPATQVLSIFYSISDFVNPWLSVRDSSSFSCLRRTHNHSGLFIGDRTITNVSMQYESAPTEAPAPVDSAYSPDETPQTMYSNLNLTQFTHLKI